jgi:transposase
VRVINCKLDESRLYSGTLQCQSLHNTLFVCLFRKFFNFCDKILQDKFYHLTVCKHYRTVAFDVCLIMITYLKSVIWG